MIISSFLYSPPCGEQYEYGSCGNLEGGGNTSAIVRKVLVIRSRK
jgi:hypothetical protein